MSGVLRFGLQVLVATFAGLLLLLQYAGYVIGFMSGWFQIGLLAAIPSSPPPPPKDDRPDAYQQLKRRERG